MVMRRTVELTSTGLPVYNGLPAGGFAFVRWLIAGRTIASLTHSNQEQIVTTRYSVAPSWKAFPYGVPRSVFRSPYCFHFDTNRGVPGKTWLNFLLASIPDTNPC